MAKPTKAQRSAAGKKAAATRAKNEAKDRAKATATRAKRETKDSANNVRETAEDARHAAGRGATAIKSTAEMTERIRELNERILDTGQKAGGAYLGAYEKTLESIVAFQEQAAGRTDVDWVSTVVETQADFARVLTKLYVSTGRKMLGG